MTRHSGKHSPHLLLLNCIPTLVKAVISIIESLSKAQRFIDTHFMCCVLLTTCGTKMLRINPKEDRSSCLVPCERFHVLGPLCPPPPAPPCHRVQNKFLKEVELHIVPMCHYGFAVTSRTRRRRCEPPNADKKEVKEKNMAVLFIIILEAWGTRRRRFGWQ